LNGRAWFMEFADRMREQRARYVAVPAVAARNAPAA
jgi:hypothetical protein